MSDVSVEVEAPESNEDDSPDVVVVNSGEDNDTALIDHTVDHAERIAALEARCEHFVTRDDLALVAESINRVHETVADVEQEIAEDHAEEIAEEMAEAAEESHEETHDEPPQSKVHKWWTPIGGE